jgi:Fe-S-cluster-containing dehydrogenase component
MTISRRDFLKVAGLAVGCALAVPEQAKAGPPVTDPNEHISMLYDATVCVGCNACTMACREWNGTAPETDARQLYDAPKELSADTYTLIQLYQEGEEHSFVKRQCMHCVDPACVSGCPVHALQKTDAGPVVYDPERCIGCRYCQYVCPFHVPRFEWDVSRYPEIKKCHFCYESRIQQGLGGPACADRCPTGALTWGKRGDLLAEAHRRIDTDPSRYVDYVYGENEAGGTSVLYLSAVPFEKLCLDAVGTRPIPEVSEGTAEMVLPAILIGGPILLGLVRYTAKRGGWEETWPL